MLLYFWKIRKFAGYISRESLPYESQLLKTDIYIVRVTQQNSYCVQCHDVYMGKDNGNPRMRHHDCL